MVYLSLGSNIGNRQDNLMQAVFYLVQNSQIEIMNISSIYKTAPYGKTDQPDFYNMVVKLDTSMSPEDLLHTTQAIENKLGRKREEHWGPRTIDIDILFYDGMKIDTKELTVPHYDFENRPFFLMPLAEIEPGFVNPITKQNIIDLCNKFNDISNKTLEKLELL